MTSSRRMAAAMSALAVVASGLVSAAVIGVAPARADHCDPAEQPSQGQQQNNNRQQRNGDQQGQDDQQDQNQNQDQDQGQNQNQDQGQNDQQQNDPQNDGRQQGDQQPNGDQQQGQDQQQDGDQQAPQGGARLLDPAASPEDAPEAAPEDEQTASTFSRRRNNPTRTATPVPTRNNPGGGNASPTASPTGTATNDPDEAACADLGPFPEDFVDIRQVAPQRVNVRFNRNGSRGTFVSQCGRNENRHNNPDNFIVAPGVSNGAHHLHDYVGNLSTDAFSTDESLAAAGTTCRLGDRSTYFWPVLRNRKVDANTNDPDGNVGQQLTARAVQLQFRGNAGSRVVAMPRFLRIITGDAKAATNGPANAKAAWSCTGFQNRITTDKYPLCPRGSLVLRILDFPSCWDGQNTDSANHRTHVVFPDQSGACPQGTRAIPQLRMTLAYSVPQGPSYALDAFPEQKHNPVTDHADFANVMPDRLMQTVVSCINRGRRC
ncbi:hypothetical protein Nocox_06375 [Nonomuraea coxensis DSM 45129]|uniref:DUF1996 domain-containing protein n=1 Tax=Nonomuraea coxensis DSM 45129 TaxID=1122611 RepID=A0ABX8TTV1_9ACTN|nr:DUF1996 domain-containing protein [Nonomuraea coxensis]QYC38902.1 hypothetical protein Nocox_06375 [Nonomuraea coxensis DSM 45129]